MLFPHISWFITFKSCILCSENGNFVLEINISWITVGTMKRWSLIFVVKWHYNKKTIIGQYKHILYVAPITAILMNMLPQSCEIIF